MNKQTMARVISLVLGGSAQDLEDTHTHKQLEEVINNIVEAGNNNVQEDTMYEDEVTEEAEVQEVQHATDLKSKVLVYLALTELVREATVSNMKVVRVFNGVNIYIDPEYYKENNECMYAFMGEVAKRARLKGHRAAFNRVARGPSFLWIGSK